MVNAKLERALARLPGPVEQIESVLYISMIHMKARISYGSNIPNCFSSIAAMLRKSSRSTRRPKLGCRPF